MRFDPHQLTAALLGIVVAGWLGSARAADITATTDPASPTLPADVTIILQGLPQTAPGTFSLSGPVNMSPEGWQMSVWPVRDYQEKRHFFSQNLNVLRMANEQLADQWCRRIVEAKRSLQDWQLPDKNARIQPMAGRSCGGQWAHKPQHPAGTTSAYDAESYIYGYYYSTGIYYVSYEIKYTYEAGQVIGPVPDTSIFPRIAGVIDGLAANPPPLPRAAPPTRAAEPVAKSNPPASDVGNDSDTDGESPDVSRLSDQQLTILQKLLQTESGRMLVGSLASAGIAALAAFLSMVQSGTSPLQAYGEVARLLRGESPPDPYVAWRAKYSALGWKYEEEGGVARFVPVEGSRDEQGRLYDPVSGTFRTPPPPLPQHQDGDVNDRGEVWSAEDRGWIGRNMYDWERRNAAEAQRLAAYNRTHDGAWEQQTQALAHDIATEKAELAAQAKAKELVEQSRGQLGQLLSDISARDAREGVMDADHRAVLSALADKISSAGAGGDYIAALRQMRQIGGALAVQARENYKPNYTMTDAVLDTALQTGAIALDVALTKGAASSLVSGGLAAREVGRAGGSRGQMLSAGFKAGSVEAAMWGGFEGLSRGWSLIAGRSGLSAEAAALIAKRDAAIAVREGAQSGLVEASQRNLAALERQVSGELGARKVSRELVLDLQANAHQVRALKQIGSEEAQQGFNNTLRNEIYKPHDLELKRVMEDRLGGRVEVQEFRTPGSKANPLNTDRDFRLLEQKGDKWVEVPKAEWEQQSHEIFANLTGFDPARAPAGMTLSEQQSWWAQKYGFTPTDRTFVEAGRDYSDQIVDLATGRRLNLPTSVGATEVPGLGLTRIEELKGIASGKMPVPQTPVLLHDAQGLGLQYQEKITGNLMRGDSFEAIAQAKKGIETLESVQAAYTAQGIDTGWASESFQQAARLIRDANLPAVPDASALQKLHSQLSALGVHGIGDFSNKLASQFSMLKFAR